LTKNKTNEKLGIPYFEGDLLHTSDWKEKGDKVLIASGSTPAPNQKSDNVEDYTVSFPRLFRSSGTETYDYLVCLEDGSRSIRLASGQNGSIYISPLLNVSTNENTEKEGEEFENNEENNSWIWEAPGTVKPLPFLQKQTKTEDSFGKRGELAKNSLGHGPNAHLPVHQFSSNQTEDQINQDTLARLATTGFNNTSDKWKN